MTISVQSSTAALVALENLSSAQSNNGAAPAPSDPAGLLGQSPSQPSSILDFSGGAAPGSLGAVTAGLAQAASIADAAVSAGDTVTSLLAQLRHAALSASDPTLGADARGALNESFKANLAKIGQAVSQASVGGINLIDGSVQGNLQTGAPGAVGTATLTATNLSIGGPLLGLGAGASLADPATAASEADAIGVAIDKAQAAVDTIASQGQAIQSHLGVVVQAGLASSPGRAGGAGMDADAARLQALQVQQQLSQARGSVANQAPQAILALFR